MQKVPISRYEHLARSTSPNLPTLKPLGLSVGVRGPTEPCTGYGQHVRYTADALSAAGYKVHVNNTRSVAGSDTLVGPHHLLIETPDFAQPSDWWFTMHETTRLPWDAYQRLNQAKHVIVPCAWNASCFNAQGVSADIHVCPLGVNLSVYRPVRAARGNTFTFGVFGTPSLSNAVRKNFELAVRAFRLAFGGRPGVRLQIKQLPTCSTLGLTGHNVEIISSIFSEEEIAQWLNGIDVLVLPSRCEAFGFTAMQAMACGIPVIAAPFAGPADYLTEQNGYLVDYDLVPVRGAYAETGMWAEPKVESMVKAMCAAFENRGTVVSKGEAALATARRYTWNAYSARLADILNTTGFFARKQIVYKPTVIVKEGRVSVDDVVRFYADHPGSSKPRFDRVLEPEAYTLTNTPTGMGDSVMMTDLPRAAALSRKVGSCYLSSTHFRDLIQFNPYYRDKHCPVWVSLSQVQMEYDLGPGHNFQKVRRLFGLPVDPRPSGCVIVPGATKRNRVSLHFEPGVHAASQRASIHPRAREVYPENLDIVREFIKRHPELEFFEVGGAVLRDVVPSLAHLPLTAVVHEMATCSLHLGIISGPYHLANALGVRTIVIINFPKPNMFMLPCMKNVDVVESEWLYPQSHVLHQDDDSPHWPKFSLKTLEMAYHGETYPYEDPTQFLTLVNK